MQNNIKLGENKHNVFNVGCPRIDLVKSCLKKKRDLNKLFLKEVLVKNLILIKNLLP